MLWCRANSEARFNLPPYEHRSGLNAAVLANLPDYLEYKPHYLVEIIILQVVIHPLYNQNASLNKPEMQRVSGLKGNLVKSVVNGVITNSPGSTIIKWWMAKRTYERLRPWGGAGELGTKRLSSSQRANIYQL